MPNEISRIQKLYTDLQHGESWIGNNFKETLYGIDAATAAKNNEGHTNNIWQLVSHLIYCRTEVTNRLAGNNNRPPFSDFPLPEEFNVETWKRTLLDFEAAYHTL